MNDQLLGSGGFALKGKQESDGFGEEHEALNKPETKTATEESLDFEDLESIMWRKVLFILCT